MSTLLGTIVEKDGYICLESASGRTWFPLTGNSGIASDFCESFNAPQQGDIGRRLYRQQGALCMESIEQMRERLAAETAPDLHNPDTNPNWTPKLAQRIYECDECHTRKKISTNHTGTVWSAACAGSCRDIIAPHTSREQVIWHPARRHNFIAEAE